MENASKALIIAGAILLSILIIGLGMMVFNNAKSALEGANLDAEQIDAFNSKFESYIDDNVKGSKVRSLCDLVKSSNATQDDDKQITIGGVVSQGDIQKLKAQIKTGEFYKVEAEYGKTKLIESIKITDDDGSEVKVTPTTSGS